MKINSTLILVILLIGPFLADGATRVYEQKTKDQVTTHRFAIKTTEPGYSIDLQSEIEENVIKQTFEVDAHLATLSWVYEDPKENTKVTASRQENKIFLKGRTRGKPIDKTFKINELPWNQTFNIGLEGFAVSAEKSVIFWAIGTRGPGNMKITRFKVKKKRIETITIKGKEVEAVYVTISLTGLLSVFWTGKYWYRKSDGIFLRYKGKNGPGTGISIMELVSETN
ncbi:MAG: hypothetical protein JSV88_30055 [Candidatus Aminicenantes bacterium]|nr:MAG: hypothetical protein JSV88_30055 [Candidatus Aminicenantes bacterium]